MLKALIFRFWNVAIFKASPENTPYSPFLLTVTALLYFLVIYSQWGLVQDREAFSSINLALSALGLLLVYGVYTYAIMLVYRLESRWLQTLTSLFAVHSIIHLCVYPLILMTPLLEKGAVPQTLGIILSLVYLSATIAFTVWKLLVTIYIYKIAMNLKKLPAILSAIGLFASSILVVSFLQ